MDDPETSLRALHARYCEITHRTDRYEPYRYEWVTFARNYSEQDLADTLAYILKVNKTRSRGMEIQTSVRKLICDLQEFERHRADMDLKKREQAAKARAWKATQGEQARASMCGHEPVPPEKEPVLPRATIAKLFGDMSKELQ